MGARKPPGRNSEAFRPRGVEDLQSALQNPQILVFEVSCEILQGGVVRLEVSCVDRGKFGMSRGKFLVCGGLDSGILGSLPC